MQDDVIGYRLAPNQSVVYTTREFTTAIATNAQGVRDDAIGPKVPGERRVVVLGDSLVLAVQVPHEATFCARLEARLNRGAPAGVRYRVINAGVQGYGPVEELLLSARRRASRRPGAVRPCRHDAARRSTPPASRRLAAVALEAPGDGAAMRDRPARMVLQTARSPDQLRSPATRERRAQPGRSSL